MILETLILHASDYIEWVDASGGQGVPRRPVPAQELQIRLARAPSDLKLLHKRGGTALWRRLPQALLQVVEGEADETEREAPQEPLYALEGEVADLAGHFIPRRFSLTAGRRTGHALRLFRSPLGTRMGRGGGLIGRTALIDGTPVPWALLLLQVSPPLAHPFEFLAQSDGQGEFRLSLERLPALTRDAPSPSYPATLTVKAAPGGTDPDALPNARVRGHGNGNAAFKNQLSVDVAPGRIATLASPGRDALVLRLS